MKFYSGRKSGFYFLKYISKFFLLEFHLKTASYYAFFFDVWPIIFSKNFMKKMLTKNTVACIYIKIVSWSPKV